MKETKSDGRRLEDVLYQEEVIAQRPHFERIGFSGQAPSTLRNLELQAKRDPSQDYAWAHRPFETDPVVVNEKNEIVIPVSQASDLDKLTAEGLRRSQKNTVGQSHKASVSAERKEAAANALTYSPPAQLTAAQKTELVQLTRYTELPIPVEEEDLSFAGKAIHALWKMGFPVDRFMKKKLSVEIADK